MTAESGLTMRISVAQRMVTDYRFFVRWKCHCAEMLGTRYLVHPVVCRCYQGVP